MQKSLPFVLGSIAVAALVVISSQFLGRYGAFLVHVVAIASIGALSLNLLIGWCGQVSFAHAALLGVGAYAAGNFVNAGWGLFSIVIAGAAGALTSVLIGLPALRLRGLYFAISSLAAEVILEWLFRLLEPWTNGMSGLSISPMSVFGYVVQSDQDYAVLSVVALLITWLAMYWLRGTNLGRAFLVVRHSEIVARGMGLDVARTKLLAFLISGFFAGVAGALIGITARLAHPEAFNMNVSIEYAAMVIVGGLGSLGGSIFGAAFVMLLPELIQRSGEALGLPNILFALRDMAFGLFIILFLIFTPGGMSSIFEIVVLRRLRARADVANRLARRVSQHLRQGRNS